MFRSTCKILLIISVVGGISGFPEIDSEICVNHEDNVKLAAHESCTHYYHCEAGLGYLIDCSDFGIYRFDAKLGQCNFAHKVECTHIDRDLTPAIIVPLKEQPLEIDNKISVNAPEHDTKVCKGYKNFVTLGIKGSCTLFYSCMDDVGFLDDCKFYGPSQYDPRIGKCNLKRKVGCDDSDETVKSPYGY